MTRRRSTRSSRSAMGSGTRAPSPTARIERAPDAVRAPFRAMGTEMFLIGPQESRGFDGAFARVRSTFERAERRFSRFLDGSELSDVNRAAGGWTPVSEEFAELLALSLDGARRSGGLFDPTLLSALVAAGYDRDFSELGSVVRPATTVEAATGRWDEVGLEDGRVFLPDGVALDFGGIAKGWAADRAAVLAADDLPWAVVDAGGDLRLAGLTPEGGLDIATEDPVAVGSEVVRLNLSFGALATSSITRRAWGPRLHHVIDPRTGRPAITRVLQATAWGETGVEAEVRATWALLAGPSVLERLPAILFMERGEVRMNLEHITAPGGG